jgi:predicted NodU family carbamoyl transferase
MTAYSHHVPDEGAAFILYGPHIGITEGGATGVTSRPGKANEGASCGALMLALSRLQAAHEKGETYHRAAEEPDYQQAALENMLAQHQARILTAEDPKREISLVAYELIHKRILETVEAVKSEFHGKHIVLLGGILINVHPDHQDYFETRHYEVINL